MTTENELTLTALLTSSVQLTGLESGEIGLVSLDDLIAHNMGIHPCAVTKPESLLPQAKLAFLEAIDASDDQTPLAELFVAKLSQLLIEAAAKQGDAPLKVRLTSDDSYARSHLLGAEVEAEEVNPIMGLRGASRLGHADFRKSFELECEAIKRARLDAKNIELVVPFVRTFSEAATVIDLLAEQGLCRGADGLKVSMMCSVPANALLAETFLQYFDGFVIDIEQLAQFTLGLDIDNTSLHYMPDAQNDALLQLVKMLLNAVESSHKPCLVYSRFIEDAPRLRAWLQDQGVSQVIS
ncbi:putative PEP-binding protein [Photobacterium leiognathi]|uniref:putative PEP-binding protein n=1 Tax=Photobacterium leiognathi TaxID=553611 RepID=UPI00298262F0|nr:putative PEP-binding protein [Photobacterium leiognathi]